MSAAYHRIIENHKLGFGRKTTIPSWYNRQAVRGKSSNPPPMWEAATVIDSVVVENKKNKLCRPPFVHDDIVPPTPYQDTQRSNTAAQNGVPRYSKYNQATRVSNSQRRDNLEAAHRSNLKELINGKCAPDQKPILYPQNVTHVMSLQLDRKKANRGAFTPLPDSAQPAEQPLPYSRTRADFGLPSCQVERGDSS